MSRWARLKYLRKLSESLRRRSLRPYALGAGP